MLSKNAVYLLERRYCRPHESPEDVFRRVARHLSMGLEEYEERLFELMVHGVFLPNSPCLLNAGTNNSNLFACYSLPIEDSIQSIFATIANVAVIFQGGGGVGINFSTLREKGAPLRRGGTSSGPISFMGLFDRVVDTVKQGGVRRGALMGILNHNHPDILDFIRVKLEGGLQNFNLSVLVNDEFMNKVVNGGEVELLSPLGHTHGTMCASDLFDLICFAAWCNGDPGILFFDRINRDNPFYPDVIIDTCNPCSESPLPHWGACCLGSINLSKFVWKNNFNFERFGDVCWWAMRALTAMNLLNHSPIEQINDAVEKYFPVGLGIMGFADCLIKLGIYYDSQDCLEFIDKVGKVYKEVSESYNKERKYLYRRIIAPTGSLSILADCSSGIEPIYSTTFERRLTVGVIEETRDIYKSKYVRTAHQVSPEWHVKVLAQWQKWVDGGVSKTVNMYKHVSVEDVKKIYKMAWELGCKGITIYRDGCKGNQVLEAKVPSTPKMKCEGESCTI